MAIYECRQCKLQEFVPRRYIYRLGPHCRCPKCGTYRVSKLKKPDRIDPNHAGILNFFGLLAGGSLHHCCYCRIQFYDRRPVSSPRKLSREASIKVGQAAR
jgi:hypothetical protein